MTPAHKITCLLLAILAAFIAGAWPGLRQWWQGLPFTRQYWYGVALTCALCLAATHFDVVQAAILVAGAMWLNFLGFLLWFLFQINCT